DLKTHFKIRLSQLGWEPQPRLQHLFEFTENVRYADQAEHRLLIPPENMSFRYSGDRKKLKGYVEHCQKLSHQKKVLPLMDEDTFRKLNKLVDLLQPIG